MLPLLLALTLLFSPDPEWITLFDGSSMDGWKASENTDAWKLEDGALVTGGPRSHLFYVGDVLNHDFKNFEFEAEVLTYPGSNSGIFVHTEYQEEGWPSKGYEAQVINSSPDEGPGRVGERKLTGSLYGIRSVWRSPARNHEWFTYRIVVQGRTIRVFINGIQTVDFTEPEDDPRNRLSRGTFALQCHDPNSTVKYRLIRVKPLPDDLPTPGTPEPDPEYLARLAPLAGRNIPLMDLHVHAKGGLTVDAALDNARRYGFTYGFAVNGGLGMTLENADAMRTYLDTVQIPPHAYHALQAEGREWLDLFPEELIARFDYVFTDAMTWTNDAGRRMRLWMPDEVEVGDPEEFMAQLVDRTVRILNEEPIDIFVNPTFLPAEIADRYDALWTKERMDRVIEALVENGIALEINARRNLPSKDFICRARDAGVLFTLGTNNAGAADLGRLERPIDMIEACELTPLDFWMPEMK